MSEKEISVISINTHSGYRGILLPSKYAENLKITANSISFKKRLQYVVFEASEHKNGTLVDSWTIKSDERFYKDMFKRVCSECEALEHPKPIFVCDGSIFTMRITYSDKTHKDYVFSLRFCDNGLDRLAYYIRKMIPDGYNYPYELDLNDLSCLNIEEVCRLIKILEERPKILVNDCQTWVYEIGKLMKPDFECSKHKEKIITKKIDVEYFDMDDIRTYLTYYFYDKYPCDEQMAKEIENGTVLKVLERLSKFYEIYHEDWMKSDDEEEEDDD